MDFFTSDTHFGHKSICGENGFEKSRRDFRSTDEMDEYIIKAWNRTVSPKDTVYHLGDFSLTTTFGYLRDIISQLNGRIIWIAGNHDSTKIARQLEGYFSEITICGEPKLTYIDGSTRIVKDGKTLYLGHFGQLTGARKDIFSIHGHIHSEKPMFTNHVNVGIDNIEPEFSNITFGCPISEKQLLDCLKNRARIMKKNNEYTLHDKKEEVQIIKEPSTVLPVTPWTYTAKQS